MNTPTIQHVSNAAVVAVPVASFWTHAPEVVTVAVGVMAFLYYLVFFVEKIVGWRAKWLQIHQSSKRVAEKAATDKAPEYEAPDVPRVDRQPPAGH